MKYRTFVPKRGPNRGKTVRIPIRSRRRSGKRKVTRQQKLLGRAAKHCKGTGKIGGKTRTSCIRSYLRKHG